MRVFITGASGWIGSGVVRELRANGHKPVGLARSDKAAASIAENGGEVMRGDLDDLASLQKGAREADAVLHLANKHDWGNPTESDRAERAAVQAMAEALANTGKPFMVTNAMSGLVEGRPVLETDASPAHGPRSDRGGSENLALEYLHRGVRTNIIRFPPTVHGEGDWGFITFLVHAARRTGVSAYVGDGSSVWSAVHRSDAARLIRRGLERAAPGIRLHAVAEQAIPTRAIADALGQSLGLPVASVPLEKADAHFGIVGSFFSTSLTGSSELTRRMIDWVPTGPSLLEDILSGSYAAP